MVTCTSCGYVPVCPRCSVSLTFHGSNGRLMCHYCNYSERVKDKCPECGGEFKFIGYGTQRVEQELKELLPSARLLRMDADTVNASDTHETMLGRFGRREADILIGTQMVTKGLDFENVTLVGVLDADMSLYADDFRAAERTFSLITQVVGRAGRGEKAGRALIQTFSPENEVICLAARQDYEMFYARETALRERLGYPPFSEMFTVTASGREEDAVMRAAVRMRDVLTRWAENEKTPMRILGPAPARIARVNNRYRCRITITGQNNKKTRWLIASLIKAFSAGKENRMISFYGDLNPLED